MADSGPGAKALHEALTNLQGGRMPQAGASASNALTAFEASGDRTGSAAAHQVLAMVAASRGDYASAVTHVEAAIPLRAATGDKEGLAALWQEKFELCLRGGDVAGARGAMQAQYALHKESGDREGAAHALHQLAQMLLQSGEHTKAEELVQEALFSMDGPQGARARSALHLLYANIWVMKGDADRAMRHAHEGLELARAAKFRPGEIDALQEIGTLHVTRGEYEAARRALVEALNGRELLKDLEGRAHVLRELAGVELATGNVDAAFEHLAYAVKSVREAGNFVGEVTLLQLLQSSADEHERPDVARQAAIDLLEAAVRSGEREAEAAALVSLATRYANEADLERARRAFERANQIQQELGLPEEAAVSLGMLGQVVWAMGDGAEGKAMLVQAHAALRRLGSDAADMLAEILLELEGDGPEA